MRKLKHPGPYLQQASGNIAQRRWSRSLAQGASARITSLQQRSLCGVGLVVTEGSPVVT